MTQKTHHNTEDPIHHHLSQDQLLTFYTPYDQHEHILINKLINHATFTHEELRAATASAINMIEHAQSLPTKFSLRQVFHRYPIQTQEGQTLFQLINQLCHIADKEAQQEFIQECFSVAGWMQDAKRRDQFFSATSSWGLSIANRFFSASPTLKNESRETPSIAQKFARKLSSPIMHKTIVQAVNRLTDPLIYRKDWLEALEDTKDTPLYLRPAFPYAMTLKIAEENAQGYLEMLEGMSQYCIDKSIQHKPMVHIELHHFTGPIDIRQQYRLTHLFQCLLPIIEFTMSHQLQVIIGSTQPFAMPLMRALFDKILQHIVLQQLQECPFGLELSAAEPSSLTTLEHIHQFAQEYNTTIPIRITKERTKPSLFHSSAIHIAYLAMAKFALKQSTGIKPLFVSHNAFTLACIHHLTQSPEALLNANQFEVHHRCGIGMRCQIAFEQECNPSSIRLEAPLGDKNHHHHFILQRLRETTDPHAFLNKLYNEAITTADLVTHPISNLKKLTIPQDNFWRGQMIHPHQPKLSLTHHSTPPPHQHESLTTLQQLKPYQHKSIPPSFQEQRWHILKKAHQHAIAIAPLWIKLLIQTMDIPRHIAELQVEAALRQQAALLDTALSQINSTTIVFPKGRLLWIGSGHRPLSPLLEQITHALLSGNQILIKPATATLDLMPQILQPFWSAGITAKDCMSVPMSHDDLRSCLQTNTSIDSVIFDGTQSHAKSLTLDLLQNPKQPPIPFWATPASSCLSTQGMCVVDETASDQELHLLAADAWKLGPMIILTTPKTLPILQTALTHWRQKLIISDADFRDTHLTQSQILQPFPFAVTPICKTLGLSDPISITAPHQESPYFHIVTFEEDSLIPLLRALAQDAQLNRCTLLTRMPKRIKNILHHLPAHEIHLGWPKEHTSFVFQGIAPSEYQIVSHILRHHRLHPWLNNGKFDITEI